MDMTKIDGIYQRDIRNWYNDVFVDIYSMKISLGTMGDLHETNKRKGYYKKPRIIFKGDSNHEALAREVFRWLEDGRVNLNLIDKYTANRFLEMLVNMRWVILHDYAVLIRKNIRNRFIITHIPEIFELAAFIDYSHKLSVHMVEQDHKYDVRIDVVLPGVLGKFYDQLKATKEILTKVTKGLQKFVFLRVKSK